MGPSTALYYLYVVPHIEEYSTQTVNDSGNFKQYRIHTPGLFCIKGFFLLLC